MGIGPRTLSAQPSRKAQVANAGKEGEIMVGCTLDLLSAQYQQTEKKKVSHLT